MSHPGKGLFITSNEAITFNDCYGWDFDGSYHYPPFSDYYSQQYLNQYHKTDLAGDSLRSKREGQSVGAIVSAPCWNANKDNLGGIELIPLIRYDKDLAPISRSLTTTGTMGPTYCALRPLQQKWIEMRNILAVHVFIGGKSVLIEDHVTAVASKFEQTACRTIAIEMGEQKDIITKEYRVNSLSMDQLIRVLNYAHDEGGRRVILINQTRFSPMELLEKIRIQLPRAERERSWSRLALLLCETESSIFNLEQFNGQLENKVAPSRPERPVFFRPLKRDACKDAYLFEEGVLNLD